MYSCNSEYRQERVHSRFPRRTPQLSSAGSESDRPAAVRSERLRPSGSVAELHGPPVHAPESPS
eukprot:SAG25_NODE_3722_length_987_cov_1.046171_2_plen_63_part_01